MYATFIKKNKLVSINLIFYISFEQIIYLMIVDRTISELVFGPWMIIIYFFLLGYWGMYLIGVHLGHYILFGNHSSKKARNIQATRVTVWMVSVLFW